MGPERLIVSLVEGKQYSVFAVKFSNLNQEYHTKLLEMLLLGPKAPSHKMGSVFFIFFLVVLVLVVLHVWYMLMSQLYISLHIDGQ